jgi:deoxyribonuclease V
MSQLSPDTSHPWNLTPQDAVKLQQRLAGRVVRKSSIVPEKISRVAGVDASYRNGLATAVVVVVSLRDMGTLDWVTASKRPGLPYISGLLCFREGPAVLDALSRLSLQPDLLIFDGQGIAHPRRFGIASHIGLLLDKPSIGCAKTRLIGRYREPDPEKGSYAYLKDQDETIGAVLRTRDGVKPVYVSVGHRVDLLDSIRIVLQCCRRYRLPEPIRRAHQLAREKARS